MLGDEVLPIEVDGRTYCQYTGLTDKNGVNVFEGDRVKVNFNGEKTFFVYFRDGMFSK